MARACANNDISRPCKVIPQKHQLARTVGDACLIVMRSMGDFVHRGNLKKVTPAQANQSGRQITAQPVYASIGHAPSFCRPSPPNALHAKPQPKHSAKRVLEDLEKRTIR